MNARVAATEHVQAVGPGAVVLSPAAALVVAEVVREHRRLVRTYEPGRVRNRAAGAVLDHLEGLSRSGVVSRDNLDGATVPVVDSTHETEYVTTDQAARALGITTAGVRRRVYRGQLEAIREGGRWLIPRRALLTGTNGDPRGLPKADPAPTEQTRKRKGRNESQPIRKLDAVQRFRSTYGRTVDFGP